MPWEPPSPTGLGPPEGTLAAFQMHRESSPRSRGVRGPAGKGKEGQATSSAPSLPRRRKGQGGLSSLGHEEQVSQAK